eukprot:TRINITY_DN12748_c0_g2_i5.p1 TRINITY_DN12748_c0_g2~~TRINITY_DN12748_c0_g2_i5.p1  ORF type:complete len:178 (-),score=71.88 TRINITY_DN12748_c0_g2_i5:125-658(-)
MESTAVKPISPAPKEESKEEVTYRSITAFGWEQDDKAVKVRITSGLDGVGKLPKENVEVNFEPRSFDLKVKDLNGANYRLKIAPLNKEINEKDSRFQVKSNSITITLSKKEKGNWDDVKEKQPLFKPKEKGKEKDEDPQASLMNMMKEMYESGDDEMKRMIAQSWSKAQSEQGKKPF